MEGTSKHTVALVGGMCAVAGSVCAVTGAALLAASGADLDVALTSGEVADYLSLAGQRKPLLIANLTIWILMAFLMGCAAVAMTLLSEAHRLLSDLARYCYYVGVPLVLAAYTVWLAIVVQIAPANTPDAVLLTEVMGWFASRADWIATILVIGLGPTLLASAGRDSWAPLWLVRWSVLTSVAAVANAIAMLTGGAALSTYGLVIIPVGVGWMLAAGVVLLRAARGIA
jgi:hypothetical protein